MTKSGGGSFSAGEKVERSGFERAVADREIVIAAGNLERRSPRQHGGEHARIAGDGGEAATGNRRGRGIGRKIPRRKAPPRAADASAERGQIAFRPLGEGAEHALR